MKKLLAVLMLLCLLLVGCASENVEQGKTSINTELSTDVSISTAEIGTTSEAGVESVSTTSNLEIPRVDVDAYEEELEVTADSLLAGIDLTNIEELDSIDLTVGVKILGSVDESYLMSDDFTEDTESEESVEEAPTEEELPPTKIALGGTFDFEVSPTVSHIKADFSMSADDFEFSFPYEQYTVNNDDNTVTNYMQDTDSGVWYKSTTEVEETDNEDAVAVDGVDFTNIDYSAYFNKPVLVSKDEYYVIESVTPYNEFIQRMLVDADSAMLDSDDLGFNLGGSDVMFDTEDLIEAEGFNIVYTATFEKETKRIKSLVFSLVSDAEDDFISGISFDEFTITLDINQWDGVVVELPINVKDGSYEYDFSLPFNDMFTNDSTMGGSISEELEDFDVESSYTEFDSYEEMLEYWNSIPGEEVEWNIEDIEFNTDLLGDITFNEE